MRWRSVNRLVGASSLTAMLKPRPLSAASGVNMVRRLSTSELTRMFSGRTSSLPASTLEMSRMSLMRCSRSLPAE